MIQPYLVKPDVCPNGCVIFRGASEDLLECPKCRFIGSSRIPACTFTYLPLKPRLSRLFNTSSLAQVLKSHTVVRSNKENDIFGFYRSPVWKAAYDQEGLFDGDTRGISLAFALMVLILLPTRLCFQFGL